MVTINALLEVSTELAKDSAFFIRVLRLLACAKFFWRKNIKIVADNGFALRPVLRPMQEITSFFLARSTGLRVRMEHGIVNFLISFYRNETEQLYTV